MMPQRGPLPELPATWQALYDLEDALYAKHLPEPMRRLVNLVPLLTDEEREQLATAMHAAGHTWPGLTEPDDDRG